MQHLIVTADDFGLHPAVNEAVERAVSGGVLSAASLMMAEAATADAVARALALQRLKVGLHLVLADGHSVLPHRIIPDLVDRDGRFGNRMFVDGVRFFMLPRVRRQLQAEIRAQFEAFARTGLVLDHVNAHKHFHVHPSLLAMIVRIGAEFGSPAVRVPLEPAWSHPPTGVVAGAISRAFLAPWLAVMKRRLRQAGVAHNDQLFGLARSGCIDEQALLEILARLPRGITEIYLHPAAGRRNGAQPLAATMAGYRHGDELEALMSTRVRAAIDAAGISVGGYRDAAGSAVQRRAA